MAWALVSRVSGIPECRAYRTDYCTMPAGIRDGGWVEDEKRGLQAAAWDALVDVESDLDSVPTSRLESPVGRCVEGAQGACQTAAILGVPLSPGCGAPRFSCPWRRGGPGAAAPRGSRRTRLEGTLAVGLPPLLVQSFLALQGLQAWEIESVISCVFG